MSTSFKKKLTILIIAVFFTLGACQSAKVLPGDTRDPASKDESSHSENIYFKLNNGEVISRDESIFTGLSEDSHLFHLLKRRGSPGVNDGKSPKTAISVDLDREELFNEYLGASFKPGEKINIRKIKMRIRKISKNDPRVSRKFANLGDMYWVFGYHENQVQNFILSGVAPGKMSQRDAEQFCRNLGGDSQLPTEEHYDVLRRTMGYPNNYNKNLISNMRSNWFWTLSLNPNNGGVYAWEFSGDDASIVSGTRIYKASVRCVLPRKVPTATPPSAPVATLEEPRRQAGIIRLEADDPRVSDFPQFAQSGALYYLWSLDLILSVTPENLRLSFSGAKQYCGNLDGGQNFLRMRISGGATAPTDAQLQAIARIMGRGTPQGYNRDLIPEMRGRYFYSLPSSSESGTWLFSGDNGVIDVGNVDRHFESSVLCVRHVQ